MRETHNPMRVLEHVEYVKIIIDNVQCKIFVYFQAQSVEWVAAALIQGHAGANKL